MDLLRVIITVRPDVTWKDNRVNPYNLKTIAKTYQSSQDIPTQEECEEIWDVLRNKDILDKKNESSIRELAILETSMPRGNEDLVDLLVAKGVITIGELPQETQTKLARKKELRLKLK